ncbi:MAG: TonB-dependent receptor plug domain-containing protein, partial [Polyangiaceae bacterium]
MKSRVGLAVALIASAVPVVARADEPVSAASTPAPAAPPPAPATPDPPQKSEPLEVRVIGGKPDSLQRVPGSGTMITRQEIERAQPTDVAEMLRRVPGVQAREEYGGGQRLDISIRGLEGGRSRRVLVLEDGIPVALNPYAEPDMYYAPPVERMRGIEVVKGSGNILFGPQTIGGVVNFLTLAPTGDQTAAVDAEGGSLGYFRGLAKYGDSYGGVRYVVQAFHKRGDGFREESFNSTDAMAKVAFDTSAKGELTFKIGFHDDAAQSDDVGLTRDMFAANPRQGTL